MTDKTLFPKLLAGDAPGAATVTINVAGRNLLLPRCVLLQLLTLASNRADEQLQQLKSKTLGSFLAENPTMLGVALENLREEVSYWKDNIETANAITDFLSSRNDSP
jgi:hypothetical protein